MYLTYNQLGFILAMVGIAACCVGWLTAKICDAAKALGEDELPEPGSYACVDQDGESTPYPAISWRNASVKVPHADASAATFHRAKE